MGKDQRRQVGKDHRFTNLRNKAMNSQQFISERNSTISEVEKSIINRSIPMLMAKSMINQYKNGMLYFSINKTNGGVIGCTLQVQTINGQKYSKTVSWNTAKLLLSMYVGVKHKEIFSRGRLSSEQWRLTNF